MSTNEMKGPSRIIAKEKRDTRIRGLVQLNVERCLDGDGMRKM